MSARTPTEFVKAITERAPLRLSVAAASGGDADELVTRADKRATTPDRLRRVLRGDLDTILAKALKTDPSERYRSVAEFADDLRRFLEHQPIAARGEAFGYRAAKLPVGIAASWAPSPRRSSPSFRWSSSTRSGCPPNAIVRGSRPHGRPR
jgi:eukaryotic-like serine/threonine-protein kinase